MPSPTDQHAPRRVLVVEPAAHLARGHYPVLAAELASALTELGCDVELLTSRGWCLAGDPSFAPVRVRRFGWRARLAWHVASVRARRDRRPRRAGVLGATLHTRALVREARRVARRGGFDDVILTAANLDPVVAARGATTGRWLSYQYTAPPGDGPLDAALAGRDLHLRVVTNVDEHTTAWSAATPSLRPTTVPFIAARARSPIPDARARLGIDDDRPVALVFGEHPGKDLGIVWQAFAGLPDWQLAVGGSGAAEAYDAWSAAHPGDRPAPAPFALPGYATEAQRGLLHAAADVVVLSFRPNWVADSGGLVDAVAWGCGVVCSEPSASAESVRRHRLGTVFRAGDADALVVALGSVGDAPDPAGLAAARAEHASAAVARRNLDALDGIGADGLAGANMAHD